MKKSILFIVSIFISAMNFHAEDYHEIIGDWKIDKRIEIQGTIYNSRYEQLENQIISICSDKILINYKFRSFKKIKWSCYTSEELEKETRGSGSHPVNFNDLGITKESVDVITIRLEPIEQLAGIAVLFIDEHTLIIDIDGNFYLLHKVP